MTATLFTDAAREMTAQVQRMLDHVEDERAAALRNRDWPELVAPWPSTSEIEFDAGTGPVLVERGTVLYDRHNGNPIYWRTANDVVVAPLSVVEAGWLRPVPAGVLPSELHNRNRCLRIVFEAHPDAPPPSEWSLEWLDLTPIGDEEQTWPLARCLAAGLVVGRGQAGWTPLRARPIGLTPDEELLPSTGDMLPGSRLVSEFFLRPMPRGFRLDGIDRVLSTDRRFEVIVVPRDTLVQYPEVCPETFGLNRVAVVNLVERTVKIERISGVEDYPLQSGEPEEILGGLRAIEVNGEPANPLVVHRSQPDVVATSAIWRDDGSSEGSRANARLECLQPAAQRLRIGTRLQNEDGTLHGRLSAAPTHMLRCGRIPVGPRHDREFTRLDAHRLKDHFRAMGAHQAVFAPDAQGAERRRRGRIDGILRAISRVESIPADYELPTQARAGGLCRGHIVRVAVEPDELPGRATGPLALLLDQFFAALVPAGQFVQLKIETPEGGELYPCPPRFGARR